MCLMVRRESQEREHSVFLPMPIVPRVARQLRAGSSASRSTVTMTACYPHKGDNKHADIGHPQPDFYLRKCLVLPAN